MKIAVLTQEDAFYIPRILDLLLAELDLCAAACAQRGMALRLVTIRDIGDVVVGDESLGQRRPLGSLVLSASRRRQAMADAAAKRRH